jgi:hypothetical protein
MNVKFKSIALGLTVGIGAMTLFTFLVKPAIERHVLPRLA